MKRIVSALLALARVLGLSLTAVAKSTLTTQTLVEAAQGWLMGTNENGVNCFLGIPYATVERFQSPVYYPSWEGLRAAMVYGESCPTGATTLPVTDYITKT